MEKNGETRKEEGEDDTFENVMFDGLLDLVFFHLYALPITSHTFNPSFVSKQWCKIHNHPLQLFISGLYSRQLGLYPPSYYFTNDLLPTKISLSAGMTRQMLSTHDNNLNDNNNNNNNNPQLDFILAELPLHFYLIQTFQNSTINQIVTSLIQQHHTPNISPSCLYSPFTATLRQLSPFFPPATLFKWMKLIRGTDPNFPISDPILEIFRSNSELIHLAILSGFLHRWFWAKDEPWTIETCSNAIDSNPCALTLIPESFKTLEMCEKAVKKNGEMLKFVPEVLRTEEICRIAINQNGFALGAVPEELRSVEMKELAVRSNGKAIIHLKLGERTKKLCEVALRNRGPFTLVPVALRSKKMCELAVRFDPMALKEVPMELKSKELCELAIQNSSCIQWVPQEHRSDELYILALRKNPYLNSPSRFPTDLLNKNLKLVQEYSFLFYDKSTVQQKQ